MGRRAIQAEFAPADLRRWRLVEDFCARLAQAAAHTPLPPPWADPQRLLQHTDYLSLFLFGLLNPVVQTMRGLCAASHLERVQQEVCSRPASLGSFSEAQHLLDPALLAKVFAQLSRERPAPVRAAEARRWLIQDSSDLYWKNGREILLERESKREAQKT